MISSQDTWNRHRVFVSCNNYILQTEKPRIPIKVPVQNSQQNSGHNRNYSSHHNSLSESYNKSTSLGRFWCQNKPCWFSHLVELGVVGPTPKSRCGSRTTTSILFRSTENPGSIEKLQLREIRHREFDPKILGFQLKWIFFIPNWLYNVSSGPSNLRTCFIASRG